jgi:hypothetical protein
MIKEKD